jgi:hypothetical protein
VPNLGHVLLTRGGGFGCIVSLCPEPRGPPSVSNPYFGCCAVQFREQGRAAGKLEHGAL